MSDFSHIDERGNAIMVDVTEKQITRREAIAAGYIEVSQEVIDAILETRVPKGDVLSAARIAGIMAAKKTSELIPLCHPLMLTKLSVELSVDAENRRIHSVCTAALDGKTGVEMEALTGVNVSLLTVYDMCKAIDKSMHIENIHLVKKTGGKSGTYENIF